MPPEDNHTEILLVRQDIKEVKTDIGDIKETIKTEVGGIKKTFEKILFPLNDWKIQTDTKLKLGGWVLGIFGIAIVFNFVAFVWKVILAGGP